MRKPVLEENVEVVATFTDDRTSILVNLIFKNMLVANIVVNTPGPAITETWSSSSAIINYPFGISK